MAAGQMLAITGSMAGVRLLTEVLPPNAYGELALSITAVTLFQQLVFGPLGNGALRFYSMAFEVNALPAYLATVRRMALTSTWWVLVAIFVIAAIMTTGGFVRWWGLGIGVVSLALLAGYNSVLDGIQNAARHRVLVAWHQGLASWGRFLLASGLVLALGASSTAAVWGYVLAMMIVLASQAWFLRNDMGAATALRPAARADIDHWRAKILTYSWPFATWGLLTWAQQASDRWALSLFGSIQDVGYYAVLFQLGYYPVVVASSMLVQFIQPVLFWRASSMSNSASLERALLLNRRVVWLALAVTGAGIVGAFWVDKWIFGVFAASQYATVAHLLPWMVCSGGIFAIGQLFALELMTSFNSSSLIAPKTISAVAGVGLNVIGAALYGVPGVVVASVLGSSVYLTLVYMWSAQARRIRARVSLLTYEGSVQTIHP